MEDRDGKKPFIIPKTHTSNKDVLITEKPDSRNVTELFNDIKSYALEGQFDFRQNGCKSCDTIRNQKLQKLYNEKRIKMKKDQDPIERFAFHLITYRDVALNVANDGLRCEQLSFPIEKYLGNPKDGVHLSRRPDVLLTSSGAQGLYRFGLLVCKVLLGKGYATIPSTNNNQLPAQLHYDHHFCKIQSIIKEQRQIDDLLANSLIFCYEHENFETISNPPQILPIAILWYDLIERFPPELIRTTNQESQHRNGIMTNKGKSIKKKTSNLLKQNDPSILNKSITSNSGALEGPPQESTTTETTQNSSTTELSTTKYPSHFMVPYHRAYSNPAVIPSSNTEQQTTPIQQIISSRDPRLVRTKRETISTSSETIPLSPQHLLNERSLSDGSISTKTFKTPLNEPVLITKSISMIYIPLNSSVLLIDPRLKTLKLTRNIFYLELQAVKHALQQQKRLNHYYDSKTGLAPKTSYTLIPFLLRQVSNDEYQRLLNDDNNTYKFNKHSNGIDYSLLSISVVDCLNFGLIKSTKANQIYVDLEQNENKLALEQIEISNELIQREKQLNSQQIHLRLREKRQRRIQQMNEKKINEKQNFKSSIISSSVPNSKLYIATGRQLLKEHKISTIPSNTYLLPHLLDFLSQEYKTENRPRVKHLLAELVGVFIDKYHIGHNQTIKNDGQNGEGNHSSVEVPLVDDQTMNSVIDMDLDSPSPQDLCDHDERFRVPTPPPPPLPPPVTLPPLPPPSETIYTQSLMLTPTLSNEPNKVFNDQNYNDHRDKLVEQLREHRQKELTTSNSLLTTKSESVISTEQAVLKACLGQFELSSSSSENSLIDDNQQLIINEDFQQEENILLPLVQDDSNRSRDEFVKLLTKEACVLKPSSPVKNQKNRKHSYNYPRYRRPSHDDNDNEKKTSPNRSNPHRCYTRPSKKKTRRRKSPLKNVSSNRTVLISNRSIISNENEVNNQNTDISTDNQNDIHEEPKVKRIKVDPLSPSPNTTDKFDNINETNQKDLGLKSIVTVPAIADDHDYRRDLIEKRRTGPTNNSSVSTIDDSKTKSSRSRSRSKSKDHHRERQRSLTTSYNSSIKNSKIVSESNEKSKNYSRSSSISNRASSKHNQHRYQQQLNRDKYQYERQRSFDLSNRHHKQYSNQLSDRHEIFNETSFRNSLPSIYHQPNINDLPLPGNLHHQQPVRHKRFNYNHQSVADHPRFANPNILPTPTPLMDFNYSKSPPHHHRASSSPIGDRKINSSYYQHNYINHSTSPTINHSNCFESKPSNTIELLQIFLENKTNESFEQPQMNYSINKPIQYSSSSTNYDNSHWSSSSYTATTKSDTTVQNNNQTFTYNDSEKLLTMVQHLRNK